MYYSTVKVQTSSEYKWSRKELIMMLIKTMVLKTADDFNDKE